MDNSQNRLALVTGGNRGIGLEICRQLAAQGNQVILTSRDEAQGREAVEKLRRFDLPVEWLQLDVTDRGSITRLYEEVLDKKGKLDILVNNAAVYIDNRHSLLELDFDILRLSMETNAYGPLYLTQFFVPLMRKHNYGRIVNVSSGIGELGGLSASYPAYRLSKILLNIQTRIIAGELTDTNILINAMCPGWVRTDMGGSNASRSVEEGADTAVWLALLPEDGPQGGYFRDRKPVPW